MIPSWWSTVRTSPPGLPELVLRSDRSGHRVRFRRRGDHRSERHLDLRQRQPVDRQCGRATRSEAGPIYALKIVTPYVTPPATAIWYPEDPADPTNLYDNPLPGGGHLSDITCGSITRLDAVCTDNLYGVQGEAAFTLRLPGTDYEYDAQLVLGDGITTVCTTHENNVDINDPTQDGPALVTALRIWATCCVAR